MTQAQPLSEVLIEVVQQDAAATVTADSGMSPPYISFLTFLEALHALAAQDPLDDIAIARMREWHGAALGAQVVAAFRFLGLLAEDGPTEPLFQFAKADGQHQKVLVADRLRASYRSLPVEQLPQASLASLRQWLAGGYGLSGDTLRKAAAFLINGLKYAGTPISLELASSVRARQPSVRLAGKGVRSSNGPTERADVVMQRRDMRAASPQVTPDTQNSRLVRLASGGTVSVSLGVDLFTLSPEDQLFVLKVVALVREYEQRPVGPQPPLTSAS